jgi:hypothetical protein
MERSQRGRERDHDPRTAGAPARAAPATTPTPRGGPTRPVALEAASTGDAGAGADVAGAFGGSINAGLVQRQLAGGTPTPHGSVRHTTGPQLDTYVSTSAAIGAYVRPQIASGRVAAGHIHFLDDAGFVARFVEYAGRHGIAEPAARTMETHVSAYQDGTEIYINQNRGNAGTAIHEGMHLYESGQYDGQLGQAVSEGTTEWLCRLVIGEQHLHILRSNYQRQYQSVARMVQRAGQGPVMAAYFNGNVAGLRAAVDAATAAGRFDQWVHHMGLNQFNQADTLMGGGGAGAARPPAHGGARRRGTRREDDQAEGSHDD